MACPMEIKVQKKTKWQAKINLIAHIPEGIILVWWLKIKRK